ncbi:type II toxin-antitoxin system HicB family antitoxin [Aquincola tertiaricarbonis]|uniref:type II toxin-antitoxin system HicB family antitoxin n=1 Tax=Aquincola tertiaricarbonis TaxID=391953 RepID=UPI0012EE8EC2|nr:type II toxin-antitoxin system HicB family antitoxin [Aquincola tertiaricarbonis]
MRSQLLAYPVVLTPSKLTGFGFFISSRDLPELLSFGLSEGDALKAAAEDLALVLSTYKNGNRPLPAPSRPLAHERLVVPANLLGTGQPDLQ